MQSQGVIFLAQAAAIPKGENTGNEILMTNFPQYLGLGVFLACIALIFFVFSTQVKPTKAIAIEPTPNEHREVFAHTLIASPSAHEQPQQLIAAEAPQPTPTESLPQTYLTPPQPTEQIIPRTTPTPLPLVQQVQAASIGIFQQPLASYRSVSTYFSSYHPGVDLTDPTGTPVMAAASGVVIHAGWTSDGYGQSIVIDHQNGMTTRYAHLSVISVNMGQTVSAGQVIGAVGCTGNCTGSHLHFEVRIHGVAQNPFTYLPH